MEGLDGGRINIATCSVGTAQQAIVDATAYVKDRQQFNSAISEFQHTQFQIADMLTELVASRQMIRLAASKLDNGDPNASTYCAMAKRFATDAGFKCVTTRCSCSAAMAIFVSIRWSVMFAIRAFIKFSRAPMKLCASLFRDKRLMDGALEVIQ